jgi:hypothetical protein
MPPRVIHGPDGSPLKSTATISQDGTDWLVVLESRSGGSGGRPPRNPEYDKGLLVLLQRIADADGAIVDATVEPSNGQIRNLPIEEKRLRGDGLTFPIRPQEHDLDSLRLSLMRAQRSIGLRPTSSNSNPWRRIQFRVRFPLSAPANENTEDFLLAPAAGPLSHTELLLSANALDESGEFAPHDTTDARQRVLASIARRQGQPEFRRLLILAYASRCAISGCKAEPALEAAHIVPYRGPATNDVRNGLLLRADLHTLFDRGLIAVQATTLRIAVAAELMHTEYAAFAGRAISLPHDVSHQPSRVALEVHFARSSSFKPLVT